MSRHRSKQGKGGSRKQDGRKKRDNKSAEDSKIDLLPATFRIIPAGDHFHRGRQFRKLEVCEDNKKSRYQWSIYIFKSEDRLDIVDSTRNLMFYSTGGLYVLAQPTIIYNRQDNEVLPRIDGLL